MSLDEIRMFKRGILEKEIERHAADGFGRIDYALRSGGAKLLGIQNHLLYIRKGRHWFRKASLTMVPRDSEKMLKTEFWRAWSVFFSERG